jgi:hypothetical protein
LATAVSRAERLVLPLAAEISTAGVQAIATERTATAVPTHERTGAASAAVLGTAEVVAPLHAAMVAA